MNTGIDQNRFMMSALYNISFDGHLPFRHSSLLLFVGVSYNEKTKKHDVTVHQRVNCYAEAEKEGKK